MYNFITASKDATVYLQQPNQNTGLDQILEISKVYYGGIKDVSRALLKFDISNLSQSISAGDTTLTEAVLMMSDVASEEIPLQYTIYANAISQSWEMGIGTRFDNISTNGVNWKVRDGETGLKWLASGTFEPDSTGSYAGYGGVWYTEYEVSQSYSYNTADVNMDVKSIIDAWIIGVIPNDGMILRYPTEYEDNTADYGVIQLFSKETHTIHQPKLRIGWDAQTISTGSLEPITDSNLKITVIDLKPYYKLGAIVKIKILGRELYPLKTFTNSFSYGDIKYLPNTTYYQIKDLNSDDIIIPFSEYSKVSCDSVGNYIKLDFSNWEYGRQYKLEFKIDINDTTQYFDDNIIFGIEK